VHPVTDKTPLPLSPTEELLIELRCSSQPGSFGDLKISTLLSNLADAASTDPLVSNWREPSSKVIRLEIAGTRNGYEPSSDGCWSYKQAEHSPRPHR